MSEESNIHPVINKAMDFSDKFSPMLVKELRQGLKGMGFMILFIAIQAILALLILGQSFFASYDNVGSSISTAIFVCLGLATCVLQPLRGISAIGGEIKENTIDLMVITRLSAWRIVFGKWISLVSQSALIIIAVTPYLILRYFFGGMQLFGELMVLLTMFIASAGITAVFIGLSSLPTLILRGLIGLGCAFSLGSGVVVLFADSWVYRDLMELLTFQFPEALGIYSLLILFTGYLGWLALDFGAGAIAPISENRSTPRRLITLGIIAILFCIFAFADNDFRIAAPGFMIALSVPIAVISLTEFPYTTATVSVPFVKKGILGRISSLFFYPGWASGLNFVLLLFGLTMLSAFFYEDYRASHSYGYGYRSSYLASMATVISICFSCLLFPLLLVRIFLRKKAQLFAFYLAAAVSTFIIWLLITLIAEETRSRDIYTPFLWLPPIQFNLFGRNQTQNLAILIAIPTFLAYWFGCFITARAAWKHVRDNDKQAIDIIKSEKQFLTEDLASPQPDSST